MTPSNDQRRHDLLRDRPRSATVHPSTDRDFWQGFVAGLSGVLIGLSIVFNMRGLILRRKLNP